MANAPFLVGFSADSDQVEKEKSKSKPEWIKTHNKIVGRES
jgi:hypothetical protein